MLTVSRIDGVFYKEQQQLSFHIFIAKEIYIYIQSCQSVHMGNVSILVRAVNAGYLKKILAIYLRNHVTSEQSKCLSRGKRQVNCNTVI